MQWYPLFLSEERRSQGISLGCISSEGLQSNVCIPPPPDLSVPGAVSRNNRGLDSGCPSMPSTSIVGMKRVMQPATGGVLLCVNGSGRQESVMNLQLSLLNLLANPQLALVSQSRIPGKTGVNRMDWNVSTCAAVASTMLAKGVVVNMVMQAANWASACTLLSII